MTDEEAWRAAHDSEAQVRFDPSSGNASFAYEEDGQKHDIWMLDAASAWNQLRAMQGLRLTESLAEGW